MTLSLVLEEIDPDTNCIAGLAFFDAVNIDELESVTEIYFEDDRDIAYQYDLLPEEMDLIKRHYVLESITGKSGGRLRARAPYDELPYLLHTGRELSLMLSGVKPMAYFVYFEGEEFRDPVDEAFDRHVSSRAIIHSEHCLILGGAVKRKAVYTIYTLPGEEWRADALMQLRKSASESGWSEERVRLEGTLLGYEDWQNDVYVNYSRAQSQRRGD